MKTDCFFSCLLWWFLMLSIHKERCESRKGCLRSPHEYAKAETSKLVGCTELLSMQDLHLLSFLASWTTAMEFVAGALQKKASYKEVAPRQTPLHCSYTENHLRVGQHLWWLSSPNQGVYGDCQVRSAVTLLGPGISHRDSDHPVGQTCIHTLAMSYVTDRLVPSSHLKQRRKQYWSLELLWWLKS